MTAPDDDKTRLERLLEVGVYAPIGFLVTRGKTMPDLAAAGRKQIAFAQTLGRAALKTLARGMRRDQDPPVALRAPTSAPEPKQTFVVEEAAGPAEEAVFDTPDPVDPVDPIGQVDPVDPVGQVGRVDVAVRSGSADAADQQHDVPETADDTLAAAEGPDEDPSDAGEPASNTGEIADYDDLTAREIIDRVREGDPELARWVHDRETAGKGRVTVLRAALRVLD